MGSSQGKIVFPPEMLFHIIKVVDPDFDRATAFYRDEAKTNNRKLNEVKQLLLNLRCTNHDWETSINQIFNEIPIGNKILRRGQSPTPHFASIMRFYPNFLQPDEIQTQYKQLTLPESHFKNLVSFKVIYNARPSNKEEIRLLGDALESRANTLKYLNLRISLDEEDAKGFSERLAKLKKLEFLHINMDMVDPKGREHLIHSLADIPSLENIYLSHFSGDLECNAMATALRKKGSLPNIMKMLLYSTKSREGTGYNPDGYFDGSQPLDNKFEGYGKGGKVTKTNFTSAIQEHSNHETIKWYVWF